MSAVGGEGVAIEHACEAVNWSGCDDPYLRQSRSDRMTGTELEIVTPAAAHHLRITSEGSRNLQSFVQVLTSCRR